MPISLVADFDSLESARSARDKLISAGVPADHIDSYPTLEAPDLREPDAEEKVQGAETPLSESGPLGHLQALLAKAFNAKTSGSATSHSEPTSDPVGSTYVFLAVHIDESQDQRQLLQALLRESGASRVEEHQ